MPTPIGFAPTPNFWKEVRDRVKHNKGYARNLRNHGPFIGSIGEVAFEHWFKGSDDARQLVYVGDKVQDYRLESLPAITEAPGGESLTVDVKTKLRTALDLSASDWLGWEVSIPEYLIERGRLEGTAPDRIVAASVQSQHKAPSTANDIQSIVLLGWLDYSDFLKLAKKIAAGTLMGGGRPSPAAMRNVFIRQLQSLPIR